MRLLLIGPPASGKGTQAAVIADHYGIVHISSGELLRQHIAEGTPTGRAAADYVQRGDLVPDEVVMEILREPVEAAGRKGGYVLDGFPRTVEQARAAGEWVRVAVYLEASLDVLIDRMRARAHSAGRDDDTESVMRHRIREFEKVTPELLDHYERHATLLCIDGARSVDEVSATIISELDRVRE